MTPPGRAGRVFRRAVHTAAMAGIAALATACVGDPGTESDGAADEVTNRAISTVAATPKAVKQSPAPVVNSDPQQLVGLDPAGLTGLLGTPAFLRSDAPAELWQYHHKSCVLDLYLYADQGKPAPESRVRHFEARGRSGEKKISPRDCLAKLLRTRLPG